MEKRQNEDDIYASRLGATNLRLNANNHSPTTLLKEGSITLSELGPAGNVVNAEVRHEEHPTKRYPPIFTSPARPQFDGAWTCWHLRTGLSPRQELDNGLHLTTNCSPRERARTMPFRRLMFCRGSGSKRR